MRKEVLAPYFRNDNNSLLHNPIDYGTLHPEAASKGAQKTQQHLKTSANLYRIHREEQRKEMESSRWSPELIKGEEAMAISGDLKAFGTFASYYPKHPLRPALSSSKVCFLLSFVEPKKDDEEEENLVLNPFQAV